MFGPPDMAWLAVVAPLWPWSHRLIWGAVIGLWMKKIKWWHNKKLYMTQGISRILGQYVITVKAVFWDWPCQGLHTVEQSLQRSGQSSYGSNLIPRCRRRLQSLCVTLHLLQVTRNQSLKNHQHLQTDKRNRYFLSCKQNFLFSKSIYSTIYIQY